MSAAPNPKIFHINEFVEKAVRTTSVNLMSRKRLGIPARLGIEKELINLQNSTMILNFDGIEEVSLSVAEELGPILFKNFLAYHKATPTLYLTYANMNEDLVYGWDGMFKNFPDPMAASILNLTTNHLYSSVTFIGSGLAESKKEALEKIYFLGKATSNDLADVGIAAASRKLNALFKEFPWLFIRNQVSLDEKAWTYEYHPIVQKATEVLA
ncbi:MAG: hypothetical protein AAF705_13420 [Bacteroidota bacterium]